ncbi:MAG: RNA 2'-phosphotransferase [Chthoniobacteraceae bacterium]
MNEKQRTRTSKFLSLVLRHEPQRIGLTLDASGWAEVHELLTGCSEHGHPMSRADLEEVVATNEKKRFAFSDDGQRVRASQGHSIEVSLGYTPQKPPSVLFHGTASRFVDAIRKEGLQKRARQHVHLSTDEETARVVGQRYGSPVILSVDTEAMVTRGHEFFVSDNGVWLTDHVPTHFIRFPEH